VTGVAMLLRVLADVVVLVHLGFIVFVAFGGVLALRWRWLPRVHLPAVVWGALLEFCDWTCPLTPLENWLRIHGGATAYEGGFVDRHVVPLVYPGALTRDRQVALGVLVCAVNVGVYLFVWRRRTAARRSTP
jgi:hypothetical protein